MKCSMCNDDIEYVSTDLYYLDCHNRQWDGFIVNVVFKDNKWTIQIPHGEESAFKGMDMGYFQGLLDEVVSSGTDYFFSCPSCGQDVLLSKNGTLI